MYIKSLLLLILVYTHVYRSSADDDRKFGVKPTVDKVLELIGVGGGGGDYDGSKPNESGESGQTVEVTQYPDTCGKILDETSYGGEEVSGCKVTFPATSNCCSCQIRHFCGT